MSIQNGDATPLSENIDQNLPGNKYLSGHIKLLSPEELHSNPRNARTHSKRQLKQIAASIGKFGFLNPILIDETGMVLAGHGRLEASKLLELAEVPVVRVEHLSTAEKRAYVLADNKLALNAGWDREMLAIELDDLAVLLPDLELDLDVEITGFSMGEVDELVLDHEARSKDPADELADPDNCEDVTIRGDLWQLGSHRLLCGDARDAIGISNLFGSDRAELVITDPPYNVRIKGHVGGRGKTQHKEFAFASGEMSRSEFCEFLNQSLTQMMVISGDGALLYVFMDWRHVEELLQAGRDIGLVLKNICVWNKTTPGQGSFYRSAHELIVVFHKPGASSINNIELGKHGRNRSNVWTYPGVNTFKVGKNDDLTAHPTVKPVTMIAEAIKDASKRGAIVFDPFLGSGTTILAAEKVGRRCYGIEYEPNYVDVAIRRWQEFTGKDAVLLETAGLSGVAANQPQSENSTDTSFAEPLIGLTFDEVDVLRNSHPNPLSSQPTSKETADTAGKHHGGSR
ncbi:MAG: site-specific DNA-methyltransferase [Opitutaceae bacterium]|nr:site-specific DNA-methyltransferase [Opitutaceae bacterium]